jgi:RNA recognition motif-containing protein
MNIYIGNIPKGTRPTELKKLLKESVRASVFSRMYAQAAALGRFDNDVIINIIKRKRFKKHGYYRYGHVDISSDRIAPVALDALQGSKIRNSKLEVREFVKRTQENDRRAIDWEAKPWNRRQRRKSDRREIS